jgi:hypothetical protein
MWLTQQYCCANCRPFRIMGMTMLGPTARFEERSAAGGRALASTLLTVFAVALAFRLGAWWFFAPPEPNYNYRLARSLIAAHAFAFGPEPTSYIEPLYPAFLASGMVLFGSDRLVLLLQAIVSASGAPALFLIGWRLTGLRSAGAWAAMLYAVDPYFVRQAHSYIEVPFAVPLLLWTLERLAAARRTGHAVAAGVLIGLVLLTRAALFPALAGLIAVLSLRRGRVALVATATAFLLVFPWTWRSLVYNDSPLPTRTGANLFVSTSPYAVGVVPRYDADLLIQFATQRVEAGMPGTPGRQQEGIADRLLMREALEFVMSHPGQTALLKLQNAAWVFAPLVLPRNAKSPGTHADLVNGRVELTGLVWRPLGWELAHAAFRTLVLVAAMLGFRNRRGIDDRWLLAVLGAEFVVYTVFFPTTRLLAPFSAVLMVYAGYGLARHTLRQDSKMATAQCL